MKCHVRVSDTRANARTRWLCTDYEARTSSDLLLRSQQTRRVGMRKAHAGGVLPLSLADGLDRIDPRALSVQNTAGFT